MPAQAPQFAALSPTENQALSKYLQAAAQLLAKTGNDSLTFNLRPDTGTESMRTPLPPILFNTMPKSGSMYIAETLYTGLGVKPMRISGSYYPDDLIIRPWIEELAHGDRLTQEHLPAHPVNLALIDMHLDRLVIHVRDPRQATLSWLHHVDKLRNQDRDFELAVLHPAPPENYFDGDFAAKLDWQIDHHLPTLIEWTRGWVDADADEGFNARVLFTRYEQFNADEHAFLDTLLKFLDISADRFTHHGRAPERGVVNFRSGRSGEWREVFSSEQQRRAASMIPAALAEKFDWPLH